MRHSDIVKIHTSRRFFVLGFFALQCAALLSCAFSGFADTSESRAALGKLEKDVKYYKLDNGLRIIMYRRGIAPVFAGVVTVRVGGSDEKLGQTGIAHMLEHMAFKGTKDIGTTDYPREKKLLAELETLEAGRGRDKEFSPDAKKRWDEILAELKTIWITDGLSREYGNRGASNFNASTDNELTRYTVNLPKPAFEFWCWVESERILNPVFRQFYSERQVVMEERRMRYEDDPQGKLYELLLGSAFLQHPYRNPVIGYPFDIRNLSATQIDAFHRKYYVPGNIVLSLVGDVDPDRDFPVIKKYFDRLPAGPEPERPTIVEPEQHGQREITLATKAAPEIMIAYRKPQYPDPDDAPVTVMTEMFAGSSISPLYVELVQKKQIASSLNNEEAPGHAYPNLALFQAQIKSPHTNADFVKGFDDVLERFKKGPVSKEQLDIAKRSIAVQYLNHLKANLALATGLGDGELVHHDWKSVVDWYDQVMKVTVADVARVANQYFVDTSRTIGKIESTK